jgi:hypothetical protein
VQVRHGVVNSPEYINLFPPYLVVTLPRLNFSVYTRLYGSPTGLMIGKSAQPQRTARALTRAPEYITYVKKYVNINLQAKSIIYNFSHT